MDTAAFRERLLGVIEELSALASEVNTKLLQEDPPKTTEVNSKGRWSSFLDSDNPTIIHRKSVIVAANVAFARLHSVATHQELKGLCIINLFKEYDAQFLRDTEMQNLEGDVVCHLRSIGNGGKLICVRMHIHTLDDNGNRISRFTKIRKSEYQNHVNRLIQKNPDGSVTDRQPRL